MPSIRRSSSFAALGSLAVAGVLFAAPVAARPGHGPVPDPGFEPTAEMLAVRALKKQIAAEELVVALELSPPQRSRLVPVIESAVAMRDDAREARAEAAAGFKPLLERYLQEVRANGAPSEATLEAMRGQREAMKGGREGKKESRQAMGEQLREILTEAQRETLGTFRPMAAVGPDPERKEAREERRGERRERAEAFAEEHGIDDEEMDERRGRRREGHAKKRGMKNARGILLSPEMLDALNR